MTVEMIAGVPLNWPAIEAALRDLTEASHMNSVQKGFWDSGPPNVAEKLCLMHSEISEALEDVRSGLALTAIHMDGPASKPTGFPTELADLLVRVFDLAGGLGINLAEALRTKMAYNATRKHKHGKAF